MAGLANPDSRNGMARSRSGSQEPPLGPPKKIRKAIIESDPEDDEPSTAATTFDSNKDASASVTASAFSMDTDISQLEAPTFTTLDRGPSQKMIELSWDRRVNLIGKKVVNPMIHNCDKCDKPILIYGRMIPCKHVFCFKCAQSERTQCPRCRGKVVRVERAGLGSIYMCSHGGSRYGSNGCRRTYLSQRDLQAHIQHRHSRLLQQQTNSASGAAAPRGVPSAAAITAATAAIVADHKKHDVRTGTPAAPTFHSGLPLYNHPPPNPTHHHSQQTLTSSQRASQQQSNLITVPILDGGGGPPSYSGQQPSQTFSQPPPNYYQQHGTQQPYQYQQTYDNGQQWQSSGRTSTQMGYYRR